MWEPKFFTAKCRLKAALCPSRSLRWAAPPLGTVAARPPPLTPLIPFPHHLHNWEYGTVSPVHGSPVGFRPDPAQCDSQSQRQYDFTTEKTKFCGSDAAAAGSFAKNFSSYTGNEAPFKAPEWGYIYSLSEKIFKETY